MSNAITVVISAAAQSVAKVFVIGLVGYASVLYPRSEPLLPRSSVGALSRFTFHALLLPLFYSTVAMTVTIESIGDYWFVIVGCIVVVSVSYMTATLMQYLIPISNVQDFRALRIAASFPNIVALPVLLFPSLCEFPIVHNGYVTLSNDDDDPDNEINPQELEEECVSQANTMIFCYFFIYMFLFWGFGYPQLIRAAQLRSNNGDTPTGRRKEKDDFENNTLKELDGRASTGILSVDLAEASSEQDDGEPTPTDETQQSGEDIVEENDDDEQSGIMMTIWNAFKQTVTSAGFIATLAGFVTACIPPLQRALFEPEAPFRFLGSAVETLGVASSPIATMVVGASLVPPNKIEDDDNHHNDNEEDEAKNDDGPSLVSHQTSGAYQRRNESLRSTRMQSFRQSINRGSRAIRSVTRSTPEMRRLHIWFCLSRLVVAPAVVVGIIVALDCGLDVLRPVPNLALLVIIINSCLPGALIVVVLLKSKLALAETASVVAKAYFLIYTLSIGTIAAWTAVGLWITLPDEDGNTVCQRTQ